jgi:hypothetical protein
MANTQAMCSSFKAEILQAYHNLGTTVTRAVTTKDTLKAALYYSTATINAGTTTYTTVGEVTSTGSNYPAGGIVVTNNTAPTTGGGTSAYWTPSDSLTYPSVTITTAFNCVLIYNSTQAGRAISVHTFGDQTVTAGTFTLTMPNNLPGTALINIA